ncbi:nose resistant to fluoxetine protein 6-like [Pecten maximus]|uniref:nose resistant to fluoxetine protein 6-like n=1 Tax=Pecten maximus TaxID=6579 RepID=UPI001458176C|nr:nose resistant to fluoxetine protein 6-like [Pecten maximus]
MNTNGNAVPEKYVLNTESGNTTLNITHVNNVEQSNNGSNGGMSTNHELPTPQSGKEKLTKRKESIFIKIIKAFALQMNIPTILSGKTPPNAVTCINGIRFISVTWVVLCHSFSHGLTRHADKVWPIVNAQDLLKLPERFTFQAIISGGSPVDTFLLLRILRLTPVYMLVLLIYATLTIHMANGPLMPVELESMQYCKDNWWTNLLYINNLVKADEQKSNCLARPAPPK